MKEIKNKPKNPFLEWNQILWVLKNFVGVTDPEMLKGLRLLYKAIVSYNETRGPVWCSDRIKLIRLELTRRLAGQDKLERPDFARCRDGMPKVLTPYLRNKLRSKDLGAYQAVFTVLTSTRSILGGKPVDTLPLEKESSYKSLPDLALIDGFMSKWNIKPIDFAWEQFHMSVKAGPNGPALNTSLHDFLALTPRQKQLVSELGGPQLAMVVRHLDIWKGSGLIERLCPSFHKMPKTLSSAKLSVKPDREAKSRIFGILDYWTQTCLKPLHLELFKVLKRIGPDKTFAQTSLLTEFRPDEGHSYHSVDLSSATDRFPILLQEQVLSRLIGPNKASQWRELLTDREFQLGNRSIRYGAGQPMGALSSWAAFTLCHHFIVYVAARRANLLHWDNYRLLGDDIVIGNDEVAYQYKKLLIEIGVEYSPHKTITSKHLFEFAKRVFYQGKEVTPFPLSGLKESAHRYYLCVEFFNQVKDRGYLNYQLTRDPDLFAELYRLFGRPHRLAVKLARKSIFLANLPRERGDPELVGAFAKNVSQWFGVTWSCTLSLSSVGRYFSQHMKELYTWSMARSAEECQRKVYDWSDKLQDELETNSPLGPDDQSELLDSWAEFVPPLAVMSREANESLDSIEPTVDMGGDGTWIWEKISRPRILHLPATLGILPDRTSYQVAQTRGELCSRLWNCIHNYRIGKRPT